MSTHVWPIQAVTRTLLFLDAKESNAALTCKRWKSCFGRLLQYNWSVLKYSKAENLKRIVQLIEFRTASDFQRFQLLDREFRLGDPSSYRPIRKAFQNSFNPARFLECEEFLERELFLQQPELLHEICKRNLPQLYAKSPVANPDEPLSLGYRAKPWLNIARGLDLSGLRLTALPPFISECPDLVALDLSNNALSTFPVMQVLSLKSLQYLDLIENSLSLNQQLQLKESLSDALLKLDYCRMDLKLFDMGRTRQLAWLWKELPASKEGDQTKSGYRMYRWFNDKKNEVEIRKITRLNLSNHPFDVDFLYKELPRFQNLTELDLRGCNFDQREQEDLIEVFNGDLPSLKLCYMDSGIYERNLVHCTIL